MVRRNTNREKTWLKLSRRSRWKFLRRASKQDCPNSIVLPLLYSAAAASVRTRVHTWTVPHELICHLRAAWCVGARIYGALAIPGAARVFRKRNRKAGTGAERTANVRRIESRLIMAFGHVTSCIPLLRSGMNRKLWRTSSFFSFLYEKSIRRYTNRPQAWRKHDITRINCIFE